MKALQDKVAIVTGGGQGLGLGISKALAAAGAQVVITGRDQAKLEAAAAQIGAQAAPVLTVAGDVRRRVAPSGPSRPRSKNSVASTFW